MTPGNAQAAPEVVPWALADIRPPTMRRLYFPPAAERLYLSDQTREFAPVLRLCGALIAILIYVYLIGDLLMFGRYAGSGTYELLLGPAGGAAVLAVLCTYLLREDRSIRSGVLACTVINGAAFVTAYALSFRHGAAIPYEVIIIYMYYVYFLLGIAHRQAVMVVFATMVAHVWSAWWVGLETAELLDHAYMMGVVTIIGGLSSRILDLSRRRNWLGEQNLSLLAERDPLTGLLNQRAFYDRADALLARARVGNPPVAFVLIGSEQLHSYNSHIGHAAADDSLRRLALLLQSQVADGDLVGKLEGEQFAVLLMNCAPEAADAFIDRLEKAVTGLRIPHPGAVSGLVQLRIGRSCRRARDYANARAAARAADETKFIPSLKRETLSIE